MRNNKIIHEKKIKIFIKSLLKNDQFFFEAQGGFRGNVIQVSLNNFKRN